MGKKIGNLWIIDDDPMASFYIKRLAELGELAGIITIYDRARGAIDYLLHHRQSEEHLPDVILLDIYMPEMDGWEFLKLFAEHHQEFAKPIEIFVISSSDHIRDITRAESIPHVRAYLQKPVTLEVLRSLVAVPAKDDV